MNVDSLCEEIAKVYNSTALNYKKNAHMFYESNKPKLYFRIHRPTKKWYVGFTTQRYAIFRHNQDITSAVLFKKKGKKSDFYRKTITTEQALDLWNRTPDPFYEVNKDWVVWTIAEFDTESIARSAEAAVIQTLTKQNVIPADLCLNTTHVACVSVSNQDDKPINPFLAKMMKSS
ncbi:hypothetical protein PBCVFr5L_964R [Paramecium bursaria Chlorella virus Fr5L]|nr:hypothetical protein PBCVFr5L_964R [Paramecium bursaria Chlorella virus Fr5L]